MNHPFLRRPDETPVLKCKTMPLTSSLNARTEHLIFSEKCLTAEARRNAEILPCASSLPFNSPTCTKAARVFSAGLVAKSRTAGQCAELAPAVERDGSSKAGARSAHSKRFARFGCGFAALRSSLLRSSQGAAPLVAAPLNRERSGLTCRYRTAILVAAALLLSLNARSQANLPIYTDNLVNGFQDWSWGTRNLSNPSPVNSGSYSISHNGGAWNALSFEHPDFNGTVYTNFTFCPNGRAAGGQILQVFVQFGPNTGPAHTLSALPANNWQHYVIPLSTLGVAAATNINRLNIQLTASAGTTTFYVDDVQLTAQPAPALVHLSLNATQAVRSADSRWFGVNTAVWDGNFDTPTPVSLLNQVGANLLRFPGRS